MENYNKVKQLILDSEADFTAFYDKGNKAAGTRVRNAMQQLKTLAQEIRQDVTGKKNEEK